MPRMMFRPGTFCRSEFQFGEHLEGNKDFAGQVLEKAVPHMGGTPPEAGDKDIGVDESGHLRLGIKGGHGSGKRTNRSNERRIIDGAERCHPFSGVGGFRNLIGMSGKTIKLLRRPVGQWFAGACSEGVKPQLQPVIEMEDESAHGGRVAEECLRCNPFLGTIEARGDFP